MKKPLGAGGKRVTGNVAAGAPAGVADTTGDRVTSDPVAGGRVGALAREIDVGGTSGVPRFVPRSGQTWRDPYPMYAALRDHDPVHHVAAGVPDSDDGLDGGDGPDSADAPECGVDTGGTDQFSSPGANSGPGASGPDSPAGYWVLSRWADVFDAVRDHATFSSAQGLTFFDDDMAMAGLAEVAPLVMTDPPAHTAFRRLVARAFTPRAVADIEPMVRDFVARRLDALPVGETVDIVAEVFKPLPSMVVGHFLGVPRADRARFDRWTEAIVSANAAGSVLDAPDAVGELFGYFTDLVERRRVDPGDDTISMLVAAGDASPTGDPTLLRILGFAFTMVAGGNDTTTGLLGGAAELLTKHRDQRRRLLDDPGLIADAVEELLRLTSPVQGLARTTTRDVTAHGVTIPAGRKVMLLYGSANRDPRWFGSGADALDVMRRPRQIMSFGYGAHHCLGAAVARLQARVALTELLRRWPDFTVDPDGGTFAPGSFVRRYESLPFDATGA